jgi:hypothetical protein
LDYSLFVEMGTCFLPGLILTGVPLDLLLQRSWEYMCKPLCPAWLMLLFISIITYCHKFSGLKKFKFITTL